MANNSKTTKGKRTVVQLVYSEPRKANSKPINAVVHKLTPFK